MSSRRAGGRRRLRRGLWIGTGVAGLGLIALVAVAHGAGVRALARTQLESALARGLGLRAEIADVELEPLALAVVARGVALHHPEHGLLVRAERLRVRPSLGSLLRGEPDLDQTAIEHGRVTLVLRDGRVVNLPEPRAGGSTTAAFHRLTLSSSTLEVTDEAGSLEVSGVRAQLDASAQGLSIELQGGEGALAQAGARHAVRSLSLSARWDGRALAVPRFELAAADGQLTLSDARLPLPLGAEVTGTLHADFPLSALPTGSLPPGLEGDASVDAELRRAGGHTHASGNAELRDARLGAFALGPRARVAFQLAPTELGFDGELLLGDGRGAATLRGSLARDAAHTLAVDLVLKDAAADWPLASLGLADAVIDPGTLGGRAHVAGTLAPLALNATLELAGAPTGWSAEAEVTLDARELRARGRAHGVTLAGHGIGELEGELSHELASGVLRVEHARGVLGAGRYELEDVELERVDGAVRAGGAVRLTGVSLTDVAAVAGVDASGYAAALSGESRFGYHGGAGAEPPRLTLDSDLALADARVYGVALDRGRVHAVLDWREPAHGLDGLALESLELTFGDRVRVAGRSTTEALELSLHAEDLPLATLRDLRKALPELDGRYDVDGRVHGRPSAPLASLRWKASALSLGRRGLGSAEGELVLSRDAGPAPCPEAAAAQAALPERARRGARWLACGRGLGGTLRYGVSWARDGARPLRGKVALEGVDLEPLVGEGNARAGGTLAITEGGLDDPATLGGTLELASLALSRDGVVLESAGPQVLPIRRGRVLLDAIALAGDDVNATLSGAVGVDGTLDLALRGALKAKRLPTLTRLVAKAYGELGLDLALRGTLADARVSGALEARDVTLRLTSFYEPIWHAKGRARLEGGRVVLDELAGELGDGKLVVSGSAALDGGRLGDYDLRFEGRGVGLEPQRGVNLAVDADVRLKSTADDRVPTLQGTLELSRLSYARHIELPAVLAALEDFERRSRASYAPEQDAVRLDLRLVPTAPIEVHNNLADARIELADAARPLAIIGTDQRPGVRGTLRLDGHLLFRGNRFAVERGRIVFGDDEPIDPSVEVVAATERSAERPARVLLTAGGDRRSFELHLTCDAEPTRPPFECAYVKQRWQCDPFAELAELWQCRVHAGADGVAAR